MATIVNNPSGSSDNSGVGMIVGIIIAIIVIALFFVYGLPRMRGNSDGGNIDVNVDLPNGGGGGGGSANSGPGSTP